jgi:hypothetical protein
MSGGAETAAGAPGARRRRPGVLPGVLIEQVDDFLRLPPAGRGQLLASMTPVECAQLFHDWTFWARSDQAPPPGDWIIWLILAGRGAGKTRAGALGGELPDRQPDRRDRR